MGRVEDGSGPGDDRFTSFDTVASKSRLMFLMTLRGTFQDYVINDAALVYLYEIDAPPAWIDRRIYQAGRSFSDEDAWTQNLIANRNKTEFLLHLGGLLQGPLETIVRAGLPV
ncbi:hypothetical protein WCLP8_3810002 [uncultured Gammaproteobacteria bacterium]